MNRRPLSVDLGLLEPLDSLSEPMADTARKITAGWVISLDKTNVRGTNFLGRTGMRPQSSSGQSDSYGPCRRRRPAEPSPRPESAPTLDVRAGNDHAPRGL